MPAIAHFDADAFFASVEQAADRRLRRRPVAVGGGARGVVCSASYEARAFGIHSAMPTRRALQLCPELTLIRGQFELYEQFSDQLFKGDTVQRVVGLVMHQTTTRLSRWMSSGVSM